jgi:hypothetical protein
VGGGLDFHDDESQASSINNNALDTSTHKASWIYACQRVSEADTGIDFEHAVSKSPPTDPLYRAPPPHTEAWNRCVSDMRTLNMTSNLMLYGSIGRLMSSIQAYCSGVVGW